MLALRECDPDSQLRLPNGPYLEHLLGHQIQPSLLGDQPWVGFREESIAGQPVLKDCNTACLLPLRSG